MTRRRQQGPSLKRRVAYADVFGLILPARGISSLSVPTGHFLQPFAGAAGLADPLHCRGTRVKVGREGSQEMQKITDVKVLEDYKMVLTFADGTRGTVDLSRLAGKGVFAVWNDYDAFREARIGASGELEWGDQIDLCPDALYLQATGKKPEDIFPNLKQEPVHA